MNHRLRSILLAVALCPVLASPWAFAASPHQQHMHGDAVLDAVAEAVAGQLPAIADAVIETIAAEMPDVLKVEVDEVPDPAPEPERSESLVFSIAHTADGSCAVDGQVVLGEYSLESALLNVHGRVRTGPSGGDCTRDSLSYGIDAERHFPLEMFDGEWNATAKFSADKRSTASTYALADPADPGRVLARADGGPYFPTVLPAGAAETVGGYLGVGRSFDVGDGTVQVEIAGNVVPVDWADGEDGRTVHFAAAYDVDAFGGELDFDFSVDAGAGMFGEARAAYSRGFVQAFVAYAFGLGETDDGAPAEQHVGDALFHKTGSADDSALTAGIGIRFDL